MMGSKEIQSDVFILGLGVAGEGLGEQATSSEVQKDRKNPST